MWRCQDLRQRRCGCRQPFPDPRRRSLRSSLRTVLGEHAILEARNGRVFLTGLRDKDAINILAARSLLWLNGAEIRPGVAYMVASGSKVHVGEAGSNELVIDGWEEQAAASPLLKMMMQQMASSDEVRQKLQ